MSLLTINAGSSSVRLDLFHGPTATDARTRHHLDGSASTAALEEVLRAAGPVEAVAHRVVHGGARFVRASRIDDAMEEALQGLVPLAPLHNHAALEWIRAARAATGAAVPHFAVFDTAFFADLPEASRTYALPAAWRERHGLRRFGFHGLAHSWMWRRWAHHNPGRAANGRLITLQLGSGCSAAAIIGGKPQETSMGFTPLEGLVMATRAGSIDPGIVTFLQREGVALADMDAMLARESGLRGLAGDGDMRRLLARDDAQAALAIEVFVRSARHYLGAYLVALGGADAVVFGGGVGENQPGIRARILRGLEWVGVHLDEAANERGGTDAPITGSNSAVAAWIVPVDEAVILAEEAAAASAMSHFKSTP